jgi:putative ATP-dependent endonuclease of OLD family
MGISVIPCMGKNNLDRPTAIFRQLQIPVYVVWDGDHGDKDARPEDNHRLLRLLGADVEDWPEGVRSSYACFEQDLETTLRAELGEELFREVLDKCRSELGFTKDKHATKCPVVVQRIIESARQEGKSSTTLECIVNSIVALRAA